MIAFIILSCLVFILAQESDNFNILHSYCTLFYSSVLSARVWRRRCVCGDAN